MKAAVLPLFLAGPWATPVLAQQNVSVACNINNQSIQIHNFEGAGTVTEEGPYRVRIVQREAGKLVIDLKAPSYERRGIILYDKVPQLVMICGREVTIRYLDFNERGFLEFNVF